MTTREEDVERAAEAIRGPLEAAFISRGIVIDSLRASTTELVTNLARTALASLPPDDGLGKALLACVTRMVQDADAFAQSFGLERIVEADGSLIAEGRALIERALRSQPPQAECTPVNPSCPLCGKEVSWNCASCGTRGVTEQELLDQLAAPFKPPQARAAMPSEGELREILAAKLLDKGFGAGWCGRVVQPERVADIDFSDYRMMAAALAAMQALAERMKP